VLFFSRGSDLHPPPLIGRCRRGFHFSSVGGLRIFKISNFDSFDPVMPPKYLSVSSFGLAQQYPPLKSHTVTLCDIHLTH
jgi:hypothetical protein